MPITSKLNPITGILETTGDADDNTITTSRNAAGQILVNGGAVAVTGGTPTVANTVEIDVIGKEGADKITLDESSGALPAAHLFGDAGNDVITGGSGADQIFGGADNDTLFGKGGFDLLFGGDGNDILIGGDADDQMFGEGGDDRMIWNPGDDTDLMEGGDGNDTVEVNAGTGDEIFQISANGSRVRFDRLNPAPFTLDIGTTENLVLRANGGDDIITALNGLAPLIKLTIDGGDGNDKITGGDGADLLFGGNGNDTIVGGRGDDTAFLGAGDDQFIWNPGDGDDTIEGEDGTDTLLFNGANIAETFTLSANGARGLLTRNVGNIVMDFDGIENIDLKANGGSDNIVVKNLFGTTIKQINLDLGVAGTGDGAIDSVTVEGTNADDVINVLGAGTAVSVVGLPASVAITNIEANDGLTVKGGDGNDTIVATTLPAGVVGTLTLDGGAGNDTIFGSQGSEIILGGDGDDFVIGGRGDDVAFLGNGDDAFLWNPGDGSDTVEGQAGTDTLQFNGANIVENIEISANGGRARLTRDVAAITMDLNSVEHIAVNALAGSDKIIIGDLSGTGVTLVSIDAGIDNDIVDGSRLAADTSLFVEGGQGADTLTGGAGNDTVSYAGSAQGVNVNLATNAVSGGDAQGDIIKSFENVIGSAHADTLVGTAGDNILTGGAGDDIIIGGGGNDTAVFNVDFNSVKVSFVGKTIVIDSAEGHDVLTGIENFQFTDGTIHLDDGNPLVNDLFYFANNHDVWDAGIDAEAHYNTFGFREGRDPNPEFSTNGYLSANPDVRAAGLNPLDHFDQIGRFQGRDPSAHFDIEQYLANNPDVAISGIDPLAHFEQFGREQGRATFDAVGHHIVAGVDTEFYLLANPDVGFANVDPLQHYHAFGFHEGRDPNAFFDTKGYLAHYTDVAAAGIDPLQHYLQFGAKEGRDPSGAFDTKAYLAANPDVAAAGVNPLQHFLEHGIFEGRSPHGDGVFA